MVIIPGPSVPGSSDNCGANSSAPHACGANMESFGTFRGRLGYAMGSTGGWLPYVTGGLAVAEIKSWDAFWPASSSNFRAGWTVRGISILGYLYAIWAGGFVFRAAS